MRKTLGVMQGEQLAFSPNLKCCSFTEEITQTRRHLMHSLALLQA